MIQLSGVLNGLSHAALDELSGELPGTLLHTLFGVLRGTGTVALEYPDSLHLLTVQGGSLTRRVTLGRGADPNGDPNRGEDGGADSATSSVRVQLHPHPPTTTAQLAPHAPTGATAVWRALPDFGPPRRRSDASYTDLRALISQLGREGFCGHLDVFGEGRGLVLFLHGRLGTALYDSQRAPDGRDSQRAPGARVRRDSDALRGIYRECLDPGARATLALHDLRPEFVAALMGLALREQDEGEPFSGLEASEGGYTYFRKGDAVLHVQADLLGQAGRYRARWQCPSLHLPDEVPGWERDHFDLTLRGRDALNPMTELAMRFRSDFGRLGPDLLRQLGSGVTPEQTAERLHLELGDLKTLLEQLQRDGLIRPAGVPDP